MNVIKKFPLGNFAPPALKHRVVMCNIAQLQKINWLLLTQKAQLSAFYPDALHEDRNISHHLLSAIKLVLISVYHYTVSSNVVYISCQLFICLTISY